MNLVQNQIQNGEFIVVEPDQDFTYQCTKLHKKMVLQKPDGCNHYGHAFNIFSCPEGSRIRFLDRETLKKQYGQLIQSCYIFKMKNPWENKFTHGIFIGFVGFVPRGALKAFTVFILKFIFNYIADPPQQSMSPSINQCRSVVSYLENLYSNPKNLYLNYSSQSDNLPSIKLLNIDHYGLSRLQSQLLKISQQILTNMLTTPDVYQNSYLHTIIQMDEQQFKTFMKTTTLANITFQVCSDAYSIALQDNEFQKQEMQHMFDHWSKNGMIKRLMTDETKDFVRSRIKDYFNISFVHPNPLVNIAQSNLDQFDVFDAVLFDPRFLMQLILCARWFAKVCFQSPDQITNNHAHLILYGLSGAGKSLILNIISQFVPTYKYLTTGNFQNPDIFSAALIQMDELDTQLLVSNTYKALLDIKSDVKIDQKNAHPQNATKDVPCIMSTNDDVFAVIKGASQTTRRRYNNSSNNSSSDAALRRLYIVPMKGGVYDKLHGPLEEQHPRGETLNQYSQNFEKEEHKAERIFNFIMAFASFQQDVSNLQLPGAMQQYMEKIITSFKATIFAQFYFQYKDVVDRYIKQIESTMSRAEVNDTEYQTTVTMIVGELKMYMYKFLKKQVKGKNNNEFIEVLRDETVSWPIKMYYMKGLRSKPKNEDSTIDYTNLLNKDVLRFINNKELKPFTVDEFPEEELKDQQLLNEIECDEDIILPVGAKRLKPEFNPDDFIKNPFDIDDECNTLYGDEGTFERSCKRVKQF